MEERQTSARPSRPTSRPNYNDADAATRSVVKNEDEGDDETYRPRPQLPLPATLKRNLAELMKFMDAGVIDVDPEYQREVVWTADRMTGLVDSLMENFYIPPIILNKMARQVKDSQSPKDVFVCVDGKQRLSSVLAFIKGMIPCHDHRGEKWWFREPAGSKRRRIFSEQQQRQFFQKEFVSFEYSNLSPEQEEDLFARVQMGVQLNLAEKMRASTGPWQELARLFVENFPAVYSLMKDRARSKDFQLTLSCFSQILECMHPTAANGVPTLKTNYTHLPKLLSNKDAVDDGLKSHLASVWNTLRDLIEADPDTFTNGNKYLRGVQTFAPVEMVAVTVLISMYSETRNNRLLLGDIQAMRTAVRENFVDLRLNASVWKWFWEYIDELEGIRGAIDGTTVDRTTKQRAKQKDNAPADNGAAGSTAAAISAAAAAPQKGRFTARTKHAAANAEEETPVVVKREPVMAEMPLQRPPKRQRTNGDRPSVLHTSSGPMQAPSSGRTALSNGARETEMDYTSMLPPMPTHASTQSPQPVAKRARQRAQQVPIAATTVAPLTYQTINSNSQAERYSGIPTPSEVRQQRVSALDSFHSAQRSTTVVASNGLPQSHEQSVVGERLAPGAPMVSVPRHSIPERSCSTWDGVSRAEPETNVASRNRSPAHPGSMQKARAARRQPKYVEIDEVVDLTDEIEQERQDLLSSFKTKPVSPKMPNKAPKAEQAPPRRTSATQGPGMPSQELPARTHNPYTRFQSN